MVLASEHCNIGRGISIVVRSCVFLSEAVLFRETLPGLCLIWPAQTEHGTCDLHSLVLVEYFVGGSVVCMHTASV